MVNGFIFMAVGLILLGFGAKYLVKSATGLALLLKISPYVIGLTVVAMGTSAPELFVAGVASWRGLSDLVLGNLVGSNILNIGLVLGLSALILPIPNSEKGVVLEWVIMVVLSFLVWILLGDLFLSRVESVLLLLLMAGSLFFFFYWGRKTETPQDGEAQEAISEAQKLIKGDRPSVKILKLLGILVGSLVLLHFGSEIFVRGAVQLATIWGIPDRIIGLTVVAFGTSLPELATVLAATAKKESDLGVGNLIGSNIFNIVGILGISGLIRPLEISKGILNYDFPWMIGFSLFLFVLIKAKNISRWHGVVLLAGYVVYAATLF